MKEIFGYMKENDANYKEDLEMALWADDVKVNKMKAFDEWHFYDQLWADGIPEEQCKVRTNKKHCIINTVVWVNQSKF
jgi:hypothetical protein